MWRGPAYLWALPNTLLGLCFWPLTLYRGEARPVNGALELCGPAIAWLLQHGPPIAGGAQAMTLGHVIIGRDRQCLTSCRQHEHVHVRQFERWGPFFIPAYLLASLIARLRGRDPYRDNHFEVEAYREAD